MGKSIPPCRENCNLWGKLYIVGKFAHCGEKVDFCGKKKIDHVSDGQEPEIEKEDCGQLGQDIHELARAQINYYSANGPMQHSQWTSRIFISLLLTKVNNIGDASFSRDAPKFVSVKSAQQPCLFILQFSA